ncbi:MAG: hypothetical protein QNJ33_04510 [Crocosphaera sp.]|nr:hypothetical protein [Crocosphaera sp.]
MLVSGITLTVRIGNQKPKNVSRAFIDAIQSVQVIHSDQGRSGFEIIFQIGRLGAREQKDYHLVKEPDLNPGNRVILIVTLQAKAYLLMDGIITHQELSPSAEPGASTFTIKGEDVSVMMDRKESPVEHPKENDKVIVEQILRNYRKYGIKADVAKPPVDAPSLKQRIPVKHGTDLHYIQKLAQRYAYVFYVEPGPKSGENTAYWGPPKKPREQPQKALTVNMGAFTNVDSINFQHNALEPTLVEGRVQDRKTNEIRGVKIMQSQRPALAKNPSLNQKNEDFLRITQFQQTGHLVSTAETRAQSMTDRSVDNAVYVSGELDTVRYGALLEIRQLVGLRGVGYRYDGLYYVKQVVHKLRKGEYKQGFTITREGLDTNVSSLPV